MDDDFKEAVAGALSPFILFFTPFLLGWLITTVLPDVFGVPRQPFIASSEAAAAKPKTIPCKILDDKAGTKECKVKLDDGRTVTCVVDSRGRSCDWRHAE